VNAGDEKVVQYLRTAYAQEMKLVRTLQAHSGVAHDGSYKKDLQHHLTETVRHARKLRERLDELGYLENENIVQRYMGTVQSMVTQGMALAKTPLDLMRGKGDIAETMLLNARDESMTEAMEIATYITLERVATNVGDTKTATLAKEICKEEKAMLAKLQKSIPQLADEVVASQVVTTPAAVRKAS
jgi:ferritin-like metal-binding protein YciE